jgi:hypothetical protein
MTAAAVRCDVAVKPEGVARFNRTTDVVGQGTETPGWSNPLLSAGGICEAGLHVKLPGSETPRLHFPHSAACAADLWSGNVQLPADSAGREFRYFTMAWDRGATAVRGILPNRMVASFAHESAAMPRQMFN